MQGLVRMPRLLLVLILILILTMSLHLSPVPNQDVGDLLVSCAALLPWMHHGELELSLEMQARARLHLPPVAGQG